MIKVVRFFRSQLLLTFVFCIPIFFSTGRSIFDSRIIKISEVKSFSTDEKRDIYSTFDTEDQNNKSSLIDPFDLMIRLQQLGEMDNATTPSDALDEALNAFDQSEYENIPIK